MILIAAVDKNWAIGKDGKLLASIRDDMEFFRETTLGNVVVMGRKTLDSLPKGLPLPDRDNLVITENKNFQRKGVTVCHSVEEVLEKIKDYEGKQIFIIGGGSIYSAFLNYADAAYITKIDYAYDADTFFPNLDTNPDWELVSEGEERTSFDIAYSFNTYKKKNNSNV